MKRAPVGLFFAVATLAALLFLLLERTGSDTVAFDEETPPTGDAPPPPSGTRPASVTALADGDSFDVLWADSGGADELRLLGVNAPESNACFGEEARAALEALTDGRELRVEVAGRDEFGRGLARVWADDIFVNARIVELGAAVAMSDGADDTALLAAAQQTARRNEVGMWDRNFCGSAAGVSIGIDAIESDAPGRDDLNPNGEWMDITNTGAGAADLTGWSIRDESTRHRFAFPGGFSIPAGSSVRIFSGCGDDTGTELYWCDGDPIWNNGGDTGFLVDADGRFVDTYSYTG